MPPALDPLLVDVLAGLGEGVALFDAEAELLAVNQAFRKMNDPIAEFLQHGTSWDILLREAEKRGVFAPETCKSLAVIESDLLGDATDAHYVKAEAPGEGAYILRLSATTEGGLLLTQALTEDEESRADTAREVELLLSKVLEACPAPLTMSRVGDGQIIYRSPAATSLLGPTKSHFSHFARRRERADFITALLPDAMVDDMRVTGMRADGSEFPAGISARLIDYRGEEVIVSMMEDLTGLLAVQTELSKQRNQIFQAEKMSALGELLAGVAHELNNPLSIIVGNTEMLKEDLSGSPHAPRLDKLGGAAERCVKIVRSFLSMARQEPLNLQPVAARKLALVAQDATARLFEDGVITLSVDLPDDLPRMLVDEVQIGQVLINLVTNAVHAIQDSGVGDRIGISAEQDRVRGMLCLRVADNGPGIDAAIASRIFDPLFTTKDVGKGTGVGLAFCHRVAAAHGGSIELASDLGSGAVFLVSLPVGPSPGQSGPDLGQFAPD